MDTFTVIKNRCAIRNFTNQTLPAQVLQQILEAGRWSPSPLNSQPWRFIVIKDKNTLTELAATARHGSFLNTAQTAIVTIVENDAKVDPWLAEHQQYIYSGVCAMQNMWLTAWHLGIGCCWVSIDEQAARELLAIPKNYTLIGSLALGYPVGNSKPHTQKDRNPLSEIVFYEQFEQTE